MEGWMVGIERVGLKKWSQWIYISIIPSFNTSPSPSSIIKAQPHAGHKAFDIIDLMQITAERI